MTIILFKFLNENIPCWYPFELPQTDNSNEYHNKQFHRETRKIAVFFGQEKMSDLDTCLNITIDKKRIQV